MVLWLKNLASLEWGLLMIIINGKGRRGALRGDIEASDKIQKIVWQQKDNVRTQRKKFLLGCHNPYWIKGRDFCGGSCPLRTNYRRMCGTLTLEYNIHICLILTISRFKAWKLTSLLVCESSSTSGVLGMIWYWGVIIHLEKNLSMWFFCLKIAFSTS